MLKELAWTLYLDTLEFARLKSGIFPQSLIIIKHLKAFNGNPMNDAFKSYGLPLVFCV